MFKPEFNQEESAQENLDFPQSLKLFNIGAHVNKVDLSLYLMWVNIQTEETFNTVNK